MPIIFKSWTADAEVTYSGTATLPAEDGADKHATLAGLHGWLEAEGWTPTGTWNFSGATVTGLAGNIDGGVADSVYGGTAAIDGGTA